MYMCGDNEDVCPDLLYIYQQDGTVSAQAVCQGCIINTLGEIVGPFFSINTRMINIEKMVNQIVMDPIPCVPDDPEIPDLDEMWPSTPLGALLWTLVADKRG